MGGDGRNGRAPMGPSGCPVPAPWERRSGEDRSRTTLPTERIRLRCAIAVNLRYGLPSSWSSDQSTWKRSRLKRIAHTTPQQHCTARVDACTTNQAPSEEYSGRHHSLHPQTLVGVVQRPRQGRPARPKGLATSLLLAAFS
jgi:hypothetical protein